MDTTVIRLDSPSGWRQALSARPALLRITATQRRDSDLRSPDSLTQARTDKHTSVKGTEAMTPSIGIRTAAAAGALVAALMGATTACSVESSRPAPSVSSAPGSSAMSAPGASRPAPGATNLSTASDDAFGQCMTEHGVPAPPAGGPAGPPPGGNPPSGTESGPPPSGSTPPPPPGVDEDTWNSAWQACGSLAPPPPTGGLGRLAPQNDALSECLTEHGVPAPPPGGPSGPPPSGNPPSGTPSGPPPSGSTPPPPPGVDQDTWNSAWQACASLAPQPPDR